MVSEYSVLVEKVGVTRFEFHLFETESNPLLIFSRIIPMTSIMLLEHLKLLLKTITFPFARVQEGLFDPLSSCVYSSVYRVSGLSELRHHYQLLCGSAWPAAAPTTARLH